MEDETLETNTNLHVSNVEDKNAQQQQPSTSGDGNVTVEEVGLNRENETTDDPRRMSSALDEHTEESSEELPRINHVNTYHNDVFTTVCDVAMIIVSMYLIKTQQSISRQFQDI